MDNDKLWPKGTIISGTMRNEDIIPALLSYVREDYKIPLSQIIIRRTDAITFRFMFRQMF